LTSSNTLILGAGLAGLSAAYHLKECYDLFERSNVCGGVARSVKLNGFTFDHAIHILYTKDPYASALIQKLLGDNFVEQSRRSFIYSHETYTPYPYQTHTHGLPKSIIKENIIRFIEAQYAKPKKPAANFEEWMIQTFGKGIAKNFMIPFNRKVWAVEPRTMGYQWIENRVLLPSLDEVLDGAFYPPQLECVGSGPNGKFWYPKTEGTQALPNAFLKQVKQPIRDESVEIDERLKCVQFRSGVTKSYDQVISTMPLPHLVAQLKYAPSMIREAAKRLRSNTVLTVNIAVDRPNISNAHWVYFPEERFQFQRISFPMNFSKSMGPEGTSSLMAEISVSNYRSVECEKIIKRVVRELIEIGILTERDKLLVADIVEITPAYVIYDDHHEESRNSILAYLAENSIHSCGRFGEWEYYNMDQAILSGKRAAEAVSELHRIATDKTTLSNA
jgi:protoporphyrinogen oxidase